MTTIEKPTCKTCGFYENNCPFIRGKFIPYPNKVCKDYTFSTLKAEQESDKDLEEAVEKQIDEALYKWSYDDEDGIEQYVHDAFIAGAEWQKQKEQKDYRKLYEDIAKSEWFKKAYVGKSLGEEDEKKEQEPTWNEEDEGIRKTLIHIVKGACNKYGIKYRGDEITEEMLLAYLEKQKEQKEWGEEDEKKMIFLERLIEHNVPDGQYGWADGRKGGFVTKSEAISMLKSLRPWKPTEEHLSALLAILNDPNNIGSQTCQLALTDLYEQLKKLNEDEK